MPQDSSPASAPLTVAGDDRLRRALRTLLGPRRLRMLRRFRHAARCGWEAWRDVEKPSDLHGIDILADPSFAKSLGEVRDLSSLDTARLANLWRWCGMSEAGAIVEVGAFRGGTTLHLSNRWPERKVFACDTFAGFARLDFDPVDAPFPRESWCNRDAQSVAALFRARGREAWVLEGEFPFSDAKSEIRNVSFAHIDVDIYRSCLNSLEYLAERATSSAIFAVNDHERRLTQGVTRAVADFTASHRRWLMIPAYPGQAVLINLAGRAEASGP
jgi:hypothetical protein